MCITSQHKELLLPVLELFDVQFDYDLDIMRPDQSLTGITVRILNAMESVLLDFKPDMVVVHGDTNTDFAAALSTFYHQVLASHVEAGLRTGDLQSPWPEEMRSKTERTEAIEAGTARLVGTDRDSIVSNVEELLTKQECYAEMSSVGYPFGDGLAAQIIVNSITAYFE